MIFVDSDWEWLPLAIAPEDKWASEWARVIFAQSIPSETVQDALEREANDEGS